jgi:hypothetical protein
MSGVALVTKSVNAGCKIPLSDSQCVRIKELRANRYTAEAIARRLHISKYDVLQVLGLPVTARDGDDS